MKRVTFVAVVLVLAGLPFSAQQPARPAVDRLIDGFLVHVGIIVPDVRGAAARYADVLGVPAPSIERTGEADSQPPASSVRRFPIERAVLPLNGAAIELVQPAGGSGPSRQWLDRHGAGPHHIAFGAASPAIGDRLHARSVPMWPSAGDAVTADFQADLGFSIELNAAGTLPAPPPGSFAANAVVHVSAMVPDVEEAGRLLGRILEADVPATTTVKMGSLVYPESYRGDRAAAPKHVTFRLPNLLLELTEPQGGASPWRDHLDRHGPSIHHLAFQVPDMGAAIRYLEGKGGRLVLGGPTVSYAYVDLRPAGLELTFELNGPRP